jgi:hypothetical protein
MNFVIHTPSVLDIREVITLGLTSKAGDDTKIGHKGSGFKFTLAYLHRLGLHLTVTIEDQVWHSVVRTETIRGKEHDIIYLVSSNDSLVSIPTNITTEAGSTTWTKPWFILRELIQNAVDEGGEYGIDLKAPSDTVTTVSIPLNEDLLAAWESKHTWMWTPGLSIGIFHKLFLVKGDECKFGWLLDVPREQLSEDRELKGEIPFDSYIKTNVPPVEALRYLVEHPFEDCWKDLRQLTCRLYILSSHEVVTNKTYPLLKELITSTYGSNCLYTKDNPTTQQLYYAGAKGIKIVRVNLYFGLIMAELGFKSINDLPKRQKLEKFEPNDIQLASISQARNLLKKIEPDGVSFSYCKYEDSCQRALAIADIPLREIWITDKLLDMSLIHILNALVEEYIHIKYSVADCTPEFQEAACTMIVNLVLNNNGKKKGK